MVATGARVGKKTTLLTTRVTETLAAAGWSERLAPAFVADAGNATEGLAAGTGSAAGVRRRPSLWLAEPRLRRSAGVVGMDVAEPFGSGNTRWCDPSGLRGLVDFRFRSGQGHSVAVDRQRSAQR